MIKKILIIASWLTVVVTMIIIFCFSQEDMEKSSQTSEGITEEILNIIIPEEEITPQKIADFHPTMRTIAHFGIFMLLGFCFANAFRVTFKIKLIFNYILAFASSVTYAIFDEIHQNFTGRALELKDILVDSFGAFIGILFFMVFFIIYKILSKKKNPS